MAVKYRHWDADDRVSAQWYAVLSAAKADGVSFPVTDGHRTLAEQRDRFASPSSASGGNPSPRARVPPPPTSAPIAPTMRSTSTRSTAAQAASPRGCVTQGRGERPSPSRARRGTSRCRSSDLERLASPV